MGEPEPNSASPADKNTLLEPIYSAASHLEDAYSKIDLARRPPPNDTEDPGLDPRNQHLHGHKFHSKSSHDRPTVVVNEGVPGRHVPTVNHHNGEPVIEATSAPLPEKSALVHDASDAETGSAENSSARAATVTPHKKMSLFFKRHRWIFILFFGLFFTSWWLSIIIQKRTRPKWLIPTVLWILLMIRFITFYVPTRPILTAVDWVYQRTFIPARDATPKKLWIPIEFLVVLFVVLVPTFVTPEYPGSSRADRGVSFFGFVAIYFVFFLVSRAKRRINWHTVAMGMFLQYIVALFVLRTKAGFDFFNFISFLAQELLGFANEGVAFLTSATIAKTGLFMITALPSIIFFIAFIHIWYYWGILQWFVGKFAYIFFWLMQVSGAEAVVAAASPFVGQGESAVLVKPFVLHMTDAELYQVMTSGFATISGSMLATYIGLGLNAQALLTSCIMSIPASLAASKLVFPETDEPLTADHIVVPEDATEEAHNVLHAFSNGAWFGLQVALAIMTNILCIIALVAMIDALLGWFGRFWGIPNLTLEQILGYIFFPISFLLGVSRQNNDLYSVAKLLGIKVIQNEFVAYSALLHDPEYHGLTERSKMLATYGLCGFANLGSVGIQIGVLGQIAPERKGRIAQMCLSSLLTGCLTTFSSAAVAGMVMADWSRFEK